ncbi:hypothetical protein BRADI_5g08336v3 [Brachypodium distachyon]|uniref:RNase H type-1 domain-containing protein n=1 Tax=Brachypodium distachyon TaxID=15368 RepID=A0A2K2CFX3_BRADI|nr:hypothetical protein BRADI_5g08336v3 [Brachypodium distachyon]
MDISLIRLSSSTPHQVVRASCIDLLKKGAIWRIGDGTKVRLWRDNWLPKGNLKATGRTDFVAWHYEKTGIFTVRSAYRLGLALKRDEKISGQGSARPNGDRALVFTWKLGTESLAVQTNRHKLDVRITPLCRICGDEEEDGYHAVMNCTKARAFRLEMRNVWDIPAEEKLTNIGPDWVIVRLSQMSKIQRACMLFIWWRAWHLRNDIQKLNVDASFNADTGQAAWGSILRNHLGEIVMSAWGELPRVPNAGVAEALACFHGLRAASQVTACPIVLATDCLQLVAALSKEEPNCSDTAMIWAVRKEPCQANAAAHELARLSWQGLAGNCLLGSAPRIVLDVCLRDCTPVPVD